MASLEWSPRFETGIASVDFEHRALIEQINRLAEQIASADDPAATEQALGEIHSGISAHFALEEAIMRKHRYDGFEPHKADHERLLDDILDMMDACRVRAASETMATLALKLDLWFAGHFRTHDARLHSLLPASR